MSHALTPISRSSAVRSLTSATLMLTMLTTVVAQVGCDATVEPPKPSTTTKASPALSYSPRVTLDTSGFQFVGQMIPPWKPDATLDEISAAWREFGYKASAPIDEQLAQTDKRIGERLRPLLTEVLMLNYEGRPDKAYEYLGEIRKRVEANDALAVEWLYTIIYIQGVTSLRAGENENCILCRGESSCILPITPGGVHLNQSGSRGAVKHFSEYLERFPDDLAVRWLLNLAHMTLGEHPQKVDSRFLLTMADGGDAKYGIGVMRDVAEETGVNRFNQAGGAIMDDFDLDGRLDLFTTSFDPVTSAAYFRNSGGGKFVDRSKLAGVTGQLGGLFCVQADFDDDGFLDIYIPRGAWLQTPIRPSLLKNNGDGTFSDITAESGLLDPVNSNSASWADYDNDGDLDLYVCCERQPNRLFQSQGDGTFRNVAEEAGVVGSNKPFCKGAAWLDIDNDGDLDLFLNYYRGVGMLFRNDGGKFVEASKEWGVDGPEAGFSCWAWDYDNDGWMDIFATCYDQGLEDVVLGLIGKPHRRLSNRLFRNVEGKRFENKTREAGLDVVYASMGSNFGDLDNDGFLDFYLATGEPKLETLVPNRMLRNIEGKMFAEITTSSRTGHLQKGHAVSFGDWDRDGDLDMFVELGGAGNGDRFHNALFQNPGQGRKSLTLRLVGRGSNRSALGARVKWTTAGDSPKTFYRHVSPGSTFGANSLELTLGLDAADRAATIEIQWPTTGRVQKFENIPAGIVAVVLESADSLALLDIPETPPPPPLPKTAPKLSSKTAK